MKLGNLSPPQGATSKKKRLGIGSWLAEQAKLRAKGTKVSGRARDPSAKPGLKGGKCPCSSACRKLGLTILFG